MGWFDKFKGGLVDSVRDLYIARPDHGASNLIWMHEDRNIPNGAKLTVRSDECAVFFREGRFAGLLEAGTYDFDTANVPFLNQLIVERLTAGHHYICELFFVRRAEFIHDTGPRELGLFNDVSSQRVVTVTYRARFGVTVGDPLALIATLGGQKAGSSATVAEFLDGRIKSLIQTTVGPVLRHEPVLSVVSNQYNEQIGQGVLEYAGKDFAEQGVQLTRFLELHFDLDAESEQALKDFGARRSELTIEREGAEIAGSFATWKLAQGQHDMLSGLGSGMAKGGTSAALLNIGIGGLGGHGSARLERPSRVRRIPSLPGLNRGGRTLTPARGHASTAATMRWFLLVDGDEQGPFTIRQVVRRALKNGLSATSAMVRGEHDPDFFAAETEDALVREFRRTAASVAQARDGGAAPQGALRQFENAFAVAMRDGKLSSDELDLLVPMAVAAGIAQEEGQARAVVLRRAQAHAVAPASASSAVRPPPPPPPPPKRAHAAVVYSYNDGSETVDGQTAADVAARIRAEPDGYHVVYSPALGAWRSGCDVAEIAALLDV